MEDFADNLKLADGANTTLLHEYNSLVGHDASIAPRIHGITHDSDLPFELPFRITHVRACACLFRIRVASLESQRPE